MVFEIIGKVVLYVIGTLFFGVCTSCLDDIDDIGGLFLGAWLAGIVVFIWLILP